MCDFLPLIFDPAYNLTQLIQSVCMYFFQGI
jgi:hypothetical protein